MATTQASGAVQWFEKAARSHVEQHQGCPWCGGRHCVFKSSRGDRVEYSCSSCDFYACHNFQTNRYYSSPGQVSDVCND
jgi:hypothetical protein